MLASATKEQVQRESMEVDVLVVGAGPAGLSTAIRLRQINPDASICVLEKAPAVGAHTISGALIDQSSLNELLPDWQERDAPLKTMVEQESFVYLSKNNHYPIPHALVPSHLCNRGLYIGSLGDLVSWLGKQAEAIDVNIFTGFCASELIVEQGRVLGVITGDMGVGKDGIPTSRYQPGMELRAKYTVFAEGCRGHLGRELEGMFHIRDGCDPQSYALGIKELWQVPSDTHKAGFVEHTVGWPLDNSTYGGSFLYQYGEGLVSIGLISGLDYVNPYFNPYKEFQRWKHHPHIKQMLQGGERIGYGARSIAAGGLQSLPKLAFPGGVLVGCEAGFLHAARIKGVHTAMKSAMLAAESIAEELAKPETERLAEINGYYEKIRKSQLYKELNSSRNFKPWMRKGLLFGSLMHGIEQHVFRGKVPWTLHNRASHSTLKFADDCKPMEYPAPDGKISFDLAASVYLSNTNHEEEQPIHLHLKRPELAIEHNWKYFKSPERNYCPAGVYEVVDDGINKKLQINAQNCLHCKACDIKDPEQNIIWKSPQGGEGPVYQGM